MGVVFLAQDQEGGREVAVKVLRAAPLGEAARRLRREARAMNAVDPRRVAQVLEIGETDAGELYLVMEYVRGKTVRTLLRAGRVPLAESMRIVGEVATTLGEAHRAGLVHRDVKPDNVMVGEDGRVVLLDFGVVKSVEPGDDAALVSTQLTNAGAVIGTPAYLSPEQALGRPVGPETDQFALAVTAYELLTGSLPWTATEVTTMLAQVLAEVPPPPSTHDEKLGPAVDVVLSRALAKKPGERFPTIEEFAAALGAATRGEYVPTTTAPSIRPPSYRSFGRVGALFGVLAIAGAALGMTLRSRVQTQARVAAKTPEAQAAASLAGSDGLLACPIVAVRGVSDGATRLGAAAASIACARAVWWLGGREGRVLPPAALLDVPREPARDLADPYASPAQRDRSIDVARGRAAAYVDGEAALDAGVWKIAYAVRTPDGREVARAEGRGEMYLAAIKDALDRLWGPPLAVRVIDPDVARWTGFPDVDVGRTEADVWLLGSKQGCAPLRERAGALGEAYLHFAAWCGDDAPPVALDGGLAPFEDAPLPALVARADAMVAASAVPPVDEARRAAARLEKEGPLEPTSVGRARMAYVAGELWDAAHEPERAQTAYLAAVRDAPLDFKAWHYLVEVAAATGSADATRAIASDWLPSDSSFLPKASSYRGDELEARLRDGRLAYVLEPTFLRASHLGRALAEAGRDEEVRALASRLTLGGPAVAERLKAYLSGFIDLHGAKLGEAIGQLEEGGNLAMEPLLVASRIAGDVDAVASRWAHRYLALPEEQVVATTLGYAAPIVLCASASRELARPCLARVDKLGHSDQNFWGEGGDSLLRGAQRYAAGDVKGAVALWRPLVAGPNLDLVRLLPTEAFEQAREPELAARLDARKMLFTYVAGVSEAAPREAKRALAAGDTTRAKDLAGSVVRAWEVADLDVPAVAAMRKLAKSLGD
jgi:hypothetical protein